ncbi:MAG: hypothetical protein HOO67_04775 [Candidatus Peribacteraceae bacterium]|nr:hypothetical protein [Candidatus Peribacteraceae bacterium]
MLITSKQLGIILRLSGQSQTELALELGVSFVTMNRWINGKVVPRKKAQVRIEALYRECTGLKEIPAEALDAKKAVLVVKARHTKNVLRRILESPDIRDRLVLTLTYTSNSIEGSTLTEAETAVVLFQNTTLAAKTLVEQLEAKNHQAALLYLFDHLLAKRPVTEDLILRLHAMLMNGIRQDAGFYRRHGVRIVGAEVATANHVKVPTLMKRLGDDLEQRPKDGIAHVADIHARLEQIHPFSDGNGRVGRLLMHAMLLLRNMPPAVIRPEKKRFYYAFLNTAQRKGDSALLQDFVCDGILEGWDILERR